MIYINKHCPCDSFEGEDKVDPSNPSTFPKFVDPLPVPKIAVPSMKCDSDKDEIFYHIRMKKGYHRFHRDFPLTSIFGYNGTYPGPTFMVEKDVPIKVKWENQLPDKHLLPIDHTLHGTMDTPDTRTVVHLHGANVVADSDGHPDAWYSRGINTRDTNILEMCMSIRIIRPGVPYGTMITQ